jgi:hypothetical protein
MLFVKALKSLISILLKLRCASYVLANSMGNASNGFGHKSFKCKKKIGAGEAIRTPDPNLGKVMLYP